MPRKGVPSIDGCLCEIKERLKALYDRTHACILRINGKTPDGNGDITLDLSDAIPGRYVESVNGQDGNVIIDKASVGLSNVDNVSSSQILNQADANNQSRLEAFEAAKLDPVELEVAANSGRIIQLEGQQVVLDDKMEQTVEYVDAIGGDLAALDTELHTTTPYVTTNTAQAITTSKVFDPSSGNMPIILKRTNNPYYKGTMKSADRPNEAYDLFHFFNYDVDNNEVVRDYARMSKTDVFVEKWASFYDDNGTVHHPQIGLRTIKATGESFAYCTTPSNNAASNAIVTKSNVMSTDGKLNNLLHTVANEEKVGRLTLSTASQFGPRLVLKNSYTITGQAEQSSTDIDFTDKNDTMVAKLYVSVSQNSKALYVRLFKNDNTYQDFQLARLNF